MVLRTRQQYGAFAVHEREDRALFAVEKLLHEHLCAGRAELVAHEHVVNRRLGLFRRLGHHHALAGGEAVRLDHDGETILRERGLRRRRVRERARAPRGYARCIHDFLRKTLRAFHARTCRDGAERLHADLLQRVDETLAERRLRSHHHEVGTVRLRPRRDGSHILRADGEVSGERCGAGVAGRAVQLVLRFVLGEAPCDRVFAPAAAYNENLHVSLPLI